MNMIIKRRQLILATLVVALGAAVFVNWYYTGNKSLAPDAETTAADYVQNLGEAKYVNAVVEGTEDYFEQMRFNRKKTNDEALDKLNKSLGSAAAGTDEAKSIALEIDELTTNIKTEDNLVNLISAKTGGECVVMITEGATQVVVQKGLLNDEVALQIMDIITRNTDLDPTKVTMSEPK